MGHYTRTIALGGGVETVTLDGLAAGSYSSLQVQKLVDAGDLWLAITVPVAAANADDCDVVPAGQDFAAFHAGNLFRRTADRATAPDVQISVEYAGAGAVQFTAV